MKQVLILASIIAIAAVVFNSIQVFTAETEKPAEASTTPKPKATDDKLKPPLREDELKAIEENEHSRHLLPMYRAILGVQNDINIFTDKIEKESKNVTGELKKMMDRIVAFEAEVRKNNSILSKRIEKLENITMKKKPVERDAFSIICYFDDYQSGGEATSLPEEIDPKMCSDIIYNSADLDPKTFRIKAKYPSIDVIENFYKRVTALKKRNPKLRVYLSLGNWGFGDGLYATLIRDGEKRRSFVNHVACFLRDYSFDGLNLLWSFPACGMKPCSSDPKRDKTHFISFLAELREAFSAANPPLLLSARVSAIPSVINDAYNVPSMSGLLDLIHVETPFYCVKNNVTCHSALLFRAEEKDGTSNVSVDDAIRHWINQGVPSKKLIMTTEAFGRTFILAHPSENALGAPSLGRQGNARFYEICQQVKRPGWTIVSHPSGGTYAYKGPEWIAYEDPVSMEKKAEYVKSMNLGGIAIQNVLYDERGAGCCNTSFPLLNAVQHVLQGSGKGARQMACPLAPPDKKEATPEKKS